MRKVKVFISSVMEGYKDRRDVAKEAIMDLNREEGFNFEVVRAENFPALGESPQEACLKRVRESDVYLGIYGERYGWINPQTNKSPTEEEFDEAWKLGKPILIFIEETKCREHRLVKFLNKVEDYTDGRFRKKFKGLDELKYEVARALRNLMKANIEEYLPNYLKVLSRRYERIVRPWEEDVGSLRTTEIVHLELLEEKEEKESITKYDEFERTLERAASKSIMLSDMIKENQRLLIIGDPGAGKSTSLQWITYAYAEQLLSSHQENLPVPVYLELKWYKNDLLELIAICFRENNVICDKEILRDWIRKGVFIFLLDGFEDIKNPLPFLKDIKELMSFSEENRFVITSRRIEALKDLQGLGFKKVEIKQLSDPQIELFLEKYLDKEKGERLLGELERRNLLNEVRNPLILWLVILEFGGNACEDESEGKSIQISINRGTLFKNVIERHFLKEWDRKVVPAEADIQNVTNFR